MVNTGRLDLYEMVTSMVSVSVPMQRRAVLDKRIRTFS
jgi:hypothetical protein